MKKKTVIISGVVVAVAALAGVIVLNSLKLPEVPAQAVAVGDIDSYVSFTGMVQPEKTRAYFGPNQVKVEKINFEVGDLVKAGDVIVEFDQQALNDQTTQAFLSYRNAQIDYEEMEYNDEITSEDYDEAVRDIRYYKNQLDNLEGEAYNDPSSTPNIQAQITFYQQQLAHARSIRDGYEKAFATDLQFERAKNAVTRAEIEYLQVKKDSDEFKKGIVAQENGIISQINLTEGGYSTAAQAAVVINHTGTAKAKFSMGKYDVEKVTLGQDVEVTFGTHKLMGKISRISGEATVNASGASTLVAEVEINDPEHLLKIGLEVDLDIKVGSERQVMVIPVESVKTDRDGDYVYVLVPEEKKEGAYKPVKKYITIGLSSDSQTKVVDGLNIGDLVVTVAPKFIDQIPYVSLSQNDATSGVDSSSAAA